MTFDDSENVPEDILSALKSDGQMRAPVDARGRVLSRLGVGVTAGAAVALSSSVSAAVGKAAGPSAAPVASNALGLGLVKALVAHPILSVVATLAVGSSVGLGAYTALEPKRAPSPVAENVDVTPLSAPDPALARALPAAPLAAPPAPPAAPRMAPAAAPAPTPTAALAADEPTTEPTVATSPVAPSDHAAPEPAPALVPAPDLPNLGPRLAEQQALLDRAGAALRRGDGSGALAIVTGHEKRYPVTAFAEEREAIGILALVMVRRADDAYLRAEAFAKRYPMSLLLPSIQRSLRPHEATATTPEAPK